jgi:hypothetical protein
MNYNALGQRAHEGQVARVRGMGNPETEKKPGGMGWILLVTFGLLAIAAGDRFRANKKR